MPDEASLDVGMNVGAPPARAERSGEPDGDCRAVTDDDDDDAGLGGIADGADMTGLCDEQRLFTMFRASGQEGKGSRSRNHSLVNLGKTTVVLRLQVCIGRPKFKFSASVKPECCVHGGLKIPHQNSGIYLCENARLFR
jgi:hypothetical protein